MNLRLLTEETCVTCGARVVREAIPRYHCNGQGFEERIFECGRSIQWVPNFEQMEVSHRCPKEPAILEAAARKQDAESYFRSLAERLKLTPESRDRLEYFLRYHLALESKKTS